MALLPVRMTKASADRGPGEIGTLPDRVGARSTWISNGEIAFRLLSNPWRQQAPDSGIAGANEY